MWTQPTWSVKQLVEGVHTAHGGRNGAEKLRIVLMGLLPQRVVTIDTLPSALGLADK